MDRTESAHLCVSAVVVDNSHLLVCLVSSGESTHLVVVFAEDAGSVASAWDTIVDHQSQDHVHWVHVAVLDALAGIAELYVFGTSLTWAGAVATGVAGDTLWTLV